MIPPSEWERCKAWIEAALEYGGGTHDIEDVRAMCEVGDARFWPGRNCAAVTEIYDYPKAKVLHLWLNGGDMDELIHELRPRAEAWGIEMGCTKATTAGRPGWDRVMGPLGYVPVARICMKELRA